MLLKFILIPADKGGGARATGRGRGGEGVSYKSQRRLDEMAPRALNYGSGEGGGDEKGRRRRPKVQGAHLPVTCN